MDTGDRGADVGGAIPVVVVVAGTLVVGGDGSTVVGRKGIGTKGGSVPDAPE